MAPSNSLPAGRNGVPTPLGSILFIGVGKRHLCGVARSWRPLHNSGGALKRVSKAEAGVRKGARRGSSRRLRFDLLWLDGDDYRNYPLVIRKGMLRHILKGSKRIIYATHFENSAAELWALAKKFEREG